MLTAYKLRSGDLLTDVDKVPGMLVKGKLKLFPRGRGGVHEMEQVFRRAEEADEKR